MGIGSITRMSGGSIVYVGSTTLFSSRGISGNGTAGSAGSSGRGCVAWQPIAAPTAIVNIAKKPRITTDLHACSAQPRVARTTTGKPPAQAPALTHVKQYRLFEA